MPTAIPSSRSVPVLLTALLSAASLVHIANAQSTTADTASSLPMFVVDPDWPSLPSEWALGEVTSIAVDGDDRVWVLHRPRSIPEGERARAAPPVLEFAPDGRLLRSWGGPGEGYDWPEREHGIWVDAQGYVWISGNGGWPRPAEGGSTDDMILKFTRDGELVLQIGKRGASGGNADTANVHQPADVFLHEPANELYVADGYGNARVIVFDADTGAFKRMWGAFGNAPDDAPAPPGTEPAAAQRFGLVHAVKVANDGIVYVADRGNRRVQWFTTAGEYLSQIVIDGGDAPAAPAGFAFSPDAEQRFLYVIESANARLLIYDRESMTLLGQFGSRGAAPGGMDIAHHIAVDSQGNLYTAEIVNNRRAQKFVAR